MKLTLSDRLQFTKAAFAPHLGLLAIGSTFIAIGAIIIYVANLTEEHEIPLFIFGGLFIAFALFFMVYTLPSSFIFYYEKALVKKYGSYTVGTISYKEIRDVSYNEHFNNKLKKIALFQFELSYTFEYRDILYESTFLVAGKECYDQLSVNSTVPIQFLKVNPKKSSVRRVKLSRELGLEKTLCE